MKCVQKYRSIEYVHMKINAISESDKIAMSEDKNEDLLNQDVSRPIIFMIDDVS